jgi:hypothetical protein
MRTTLEKSTPDTRRHLLNSLSIERPSYEFSIYTAQWDLNPEIVVRRDGKEVGRSIYLEDVLKIIRSHQNKLRLASKVAKKVRHVSTLRRRGRKIAKL